MKIIRYLLLTVLFIFLLTVLFVFSGSRTSGRFLTDKEIDLTKSIYSDNIDLANVRIVIDSMYSLTSTITLGNTIHIKSTWTKLDLLLDLTQTSSSRNLLIHELGHVYQYQSGGWGYVARSLFAQAKAYISTGSRGNAYKWEDRISDKTPWEEWNPEEQAQAISDYSYYIEFGKGLYSNDKVLVKNLDCFVPILKTNFCRN